MTPSPRDTPAMAESAPRSRHSIIPTSARIPRRVAVVEDIHHDKDGITSGERIARDGIRERLLAAAALRKSS